MAVVLPTGCPCSVGFFFAEFRWTESQSPRYSPGLGAVVTNKWCITLCIFHI